MDRVPFDSTETQVGQVGEPDAQVAVGTTGKMFIKQDRLEQHIEPNEEVGALDMLATNEQFAGIKPFGNDMPMPRVVQCIVSDETRTHHGKLASDSLLET